MLTDNYPISAGEFFIDDEMRVIADRFEKVFVVVKSQQKVDFYRYLPENMIVLSVDDSVSFLDKLKALPNTLKPFFYEEWRLAVTNYKLKPSLILFKLMYMDVVRALKLKKQISKILKEEHIDALNTVFYSYWHDYKALALSMMKTENSSLACIARAHGWDVFFERHQPPYLPFKKYMVSTLNQTYSISLAGKKEFEKLLGAQIDNKVTVSRLGKINQRTYNIKKSDDGILICSCSNLIPLKRIHLIIDLLSLLNVGKIRWVHFGEGHLRVELENYAKIKLPYIDYTFMGSVPNSEILDFYRDHFVDLFVNLSESEGIPVSIMEALSAGIPVLATDVGGTSEAVNDMVGFLIPKNFINEDVVKIVTNYLNSSSDIKSTYRIAGYHFWEDNFEARKNYLEFYNKIIRLNKYE